MSTTCLKEWFERKTCESCAFLSDDIVCFVVGWSYTEDIERSDVENLYFLVHYLSDADKTDSRDFCMELKEGSHYRLGQNNDVDELVIITFEGYIIHYSAEGFHKERPLSRDDILPNGIRYIGKHFYIAGDTRSVMRREGPNTWTNLTARTIQGQRGPGCADDQGFEAIDGFSEDDIYAIGGRGDAWHYDGQQWHPLDLPTNAYLESVCCASDGQVYIGGNGHLILRGRGDYWQIIHEDDVNEAFMQLVDYQGQILGVDEWGSCLYQVNSQGISVWDTGNYELPPTSCVCLAVGHGMLLTAGREAVNRFDGKRWRSLVERDSLDDTQFAETLLQQVTGAINQLSNKLRR